MESNLTKEQEILLNLQEKGFFQDLNTDEKAFVRKITTQKEFDLSHKILKESKGLYAIPAPRKLVLPQTTSAGISRYLIPISTAAAAAVVTFFIFKNEPVIIQQVENVKHATADTVYLHDKIVDTIIIYRDAAINTINEKPRDTPQIDLAEYRYANEPLPPISTLNLKNKGESLKNENYIGLIDGIVY